jgi:inosine-uridine nucleoside N-ribohydrolase
MKAIIDCDPGVDDALAILLALTSADTEILVYIPQFGNTSVDNAYNNLLKIYGVLDRHAKENDKEIERFPALKAKRKPIVIRGADGPIDGPSHSAAYFHGKDGRWCSYVVPCRRWRLSVIWYTDVHTPPHIA